MQRFGMTADGRILFASFSGSAEKPWYRVFVGQTLETIEPLKEEVIGEGGRPYKRPVGGRTIAEITLRASKFFNVIPD